MLVYMIRANATPCNWNRLRPQRLVHRPLGSITCSSATIGLGVLCSVSTNKTAGNPCAAEPDVQKNTNLQKRYQSINLP